MRQKVGKKEIITMHALLAKVCGAGGFTMAEYKKQLVEEYTGGRETSSKELFVDEAGKLISDLQKAISLSPEQVQADRKRKRLLHFAHQMMWEIESSERMVVDMNRVNGWCEKYGQFHKVLNEHTNSELSLLLVQFEKVYKDFLKAV